MSHTPDAWSIYETDDTIFIRADAKVEPNEQRYNARLIAAAPEILEALENLVSEIYESGAVHYMNEASSFKDVFNERLERASQAIAKAKGEL